MAAHRFAYRSPAILIHRAKGNSRKNDQTSVFRNLQPSTAPYSVLSVDSKAALLANNIREVHTREEPFFSAVQRSKVICGRCAESGFYEPIEISYPAAAPSSGGVPCSAETRYRWVFAWISTCSELPQQMGP